MAARNAASVLMAAQGSASSATRPPGTLPVGGRWAWTDKTNLPFDMDELYKACYEGQPSSEASALKTSRYNDQNPIKLVATALRKMNEDKESVAKLAPVAQFTTNNSSWQKLKPETLAESKIARQLGVIDNAMVNVATSKRVLKDVLTDEITRARPSGGLLKFYAQLLRDADKKSLALEAAKLQTEKLRRALDSDGPGPEHHLADYFTMHSSGGGGGASGSASGGASSRGEEVSEARMLLSDHRLRQDARQRKALLDFVAALTDKRDEAAAKLEAEARDDEQATAMVEAEARALREELDNADADANVGPLEIFPVSLEPSLREFIVNRAGALGVDKVTEAFTQLHALPKDQAWSKRVVKDKINQLALKERKSPDHILRWHLRSPLAVTSGVLSVTGQVDEQDIRLLAFKGSRRRLRRHMKVRIFHLSP